MTRARLPPVNLVLLVLAAGLQTACMLWINDIAHLQGISGDALAFLWLLIFGYGVSTTWISMQVLGPRLKVHKLDRLIELWRSRRQEAQADGNAQAENYATSQINAYQTLRVAHGFLPLATPSVDPTEDQTTS